MIYVCVPVLKRYDLLRELLTSLVSSTIEPAGVYIIDNGRQPLLMDEATDGFLFPIIVYTPNAAMGLAESWNWFINNVREERFIVNDDILFAPESLAAMVAAPASFVSCSFGFSCFLLRDRCVDIVGQFDETISPGYAYFEDMDYLRRMRDCNVVDDVVLCGVEHRQSSTPAKFNSDEWHEHHKRFRLAESNYTKKWAAKPNWEHLKTIGGAGANA